MSRPDPDLALYLDLFECSPSMLAIADLRGSLLTINPTWASILPNRGVVSQQRAHFGDLVHGDDREEVARALASAAAGDPGAGGEHRFATPEGWRTLAWRAARGRTGDVLHLSAVDVSERDAARAELDELAASLSHDLRAPLRAVDGFAHLVLARKVDAELPEDVRRAISLVTQASGELARLLDDLVDVARVGREPFVAGPVDVGQVAIDAIERTLRPRQGQRDVCWTVSAVPPAWGDARLVRRLLGALLDNALRWTAERDVAHIELGWDADAAAYVVRDDGAGFDDARVEQAFAIFGRLAPPAEGAGTGVGLAIARRIVARHGGRIWARSAPDEGAAFWFTLPPVRG